MWVSFGDNILGHFLFIILTFKECRKRGEACMNPRFRSCGNTYREIRGGYELDLLLAPKGKEAIALSEMCGGSGLYTYSWPFRKEDRGDWGGKEAARLG